MTDSECANEQLLVLFNHHLCAPICPPLSLIRARFVINEEGQKHSQTLGPPSAPTKTAHGQVSE